MPGPRGPLRLETSKRGLAEAKKLKNAGDVLIVPPEMPDWISPGASDLWADIIADLEDAKVPLQRIDAHAIGFFVTCIFETREALKRGDTTLARHWTCADQIRPRNRIACEPRRRRLGITPERVKLPNEYVRFLEANDQDALAPRRQPMALKPQATEHNSNHEAVGVEPEAAPSYQWDFGTSDG